MKATDLLQLRKTSLLCVARGLDLGTADYRRLLSAPPATIASQIAKAYAARVQAAEKEHGK